jgi:hypothetical protein
MRLILKQVRNVALDRARTNLALLGKALAMPGLSTAVAQTDGLATAWANVARNAGAAQGAIGGASATAARTSGAAADIAGLSVS